jgi:[protein-PII] uridylyltransferase
MEKGQLERLKTTIENALADRIELLPQLVARPDARPRADAFEVRPRVLFDNKASSRFTVLEVNAKDRPALLNRLARVLFESKLIVHSAHIATYGERAADTFYVTDLLGQKLESPSRMKTLEADLLEATSQISAKEKDKSKAKPKARTAAA